MALQFKNRAPWPDRVLQRQADTMPSPKPPHRGPARLTAAVAAGCVVALLAVAAGALFVRLGLYDVSATTSHTGFVYSLLETTMRYSVRRRARDIEPPPLRDAARLVRGAACYRDHCVQCHGGPGVAQGTVGKSLQPVPGPLIDAVRRWQPQEVYWITRHGIKMSGMPAWQVRLSDADLWAVTAFVDLLPELSPQAYAKRVGEVGERACTAASDACAGNPGCTPAPTADLAPGQGRSREEHAQLLLHQYACSACHQVPGLVGSATQVGPPLDELARRQFLPGGQPNTRENLVRWLREPQRIDPQTAMPDLGVTQPHADLMADYLLRRR
jgi:mono/diheme cytochrome c family protein